MIRPFSSYLSLDCDFSSGLGWHQLSVYMTIHIYFTLLYCIAKICFIMGCTNWSVGETECANWMPHGRLAFMFTLPWRMEEKKEGGCNNFQLFIPTLDLCSVLEAVYHQLPCALAFTNNTVKLPSDVRSFSGRSSKLCATLLGNVNVLCPSVDFASLNDPLTPRPLMWGHWHAGPWPTCQWG
jgi:hypothetical protein